MRIAVLEDRGALSDYTVEILRAWGLAMVDHLPARGLSSSEGARYEVIILPAGLEASADDPLIIRFIEQGGTAIIFCPQGQWARTAGLEWLETRNKPHRLRVNGLSVRGLAGESLPVPAAAAYHIGNPTACMGWLYDPDLAYGLDGEVPGIIQCPIGGGKLIAFAYDLPRCVMMLRQGDPALANRRLDHPMPTRRMCKPTNLALNFNRQDIGWIPFADLLGRVLVDVIIQQSSTPVPLLSTMPSGASGMVLISGDEDNAPIANIDQEMSDWSAHQVRMNMYMIPELTHSTPADVERYRQAHDLGAHPDLVPLVDESIAARTAEYERQIRVFQEKFNIFPRSIRNHAAGWAGYLDLVYAQHRCGIRMDLNYFSGNYSRERDHSFFSPFGAALPMRFCRPQGGLIDVYQQHTHLHDDILFAPDRDYSYKFTPEAARSIFSRVLDDLIYRFQSPIAANFHPGNWSFARKPALMLIQLAREKGMFLWSYDQWLEFWVARDSCRVMNLAWDDSRLTFEIRCEQSHDEVNVELPSMWEGLRLDAVTCNGKAMDWETRHRDGGAVCRIQLPHDSQSALYEAVFRN